MDANGTGSASRRAVLTGTIALTASAAAGLLAACGRSPAPGDGAASTHAPGSDPVLARAVAAEQALIAAYDAAIGGGADPLLASIRDQHRAHLSALGGTPVEPVGAAGDAAPTRASLVALEQEAAARCRQDCAQAVDAELVRTLAYIASSEASHVPALRAGA